MSDMSIKEAVRITGGLSRPSKMPGAGYSLPASSCKIGQLLRKVPGSVCASCYAYKGRYNFPDVQRCLEKRLKAIEDPAWEDAMVTLIQQEPVKFFRWHDSGDIQSLDHLQKIVNIARRLPDVQFWLPTKDASFLRAWLDTQHPCKRDLPKNITARLSSFAFDQVPDSSLWPTRSASHTQDPSEMKLLPEWRKVYFCPAPQQSGECGSCRACWASKVAVVSYRKH